MNITIIGTAGIPACYGGFETLTENLIKNKEKNLEYTVFCSAKLYKERQKSYFDAKLRYINLKANGASSIFYDLICMLLSLHSDVMLILGVSGSIFLPFIRFIYRGKIITNVDGIEWKRGKWNKIAKYILRISEKSAIKYSDVIIGDNKIIIDYIKEEYKKKAVLLEYGGDHVHLVKDDNLLLNEFGLKSFEYCCMVSRIEPENNIELILEAFSQMPLMKIVIAGRWETSKFGKNIREKFKKFNNLILLDAIYDQTKLNLLRCKSKLYIHGHSVGGTNPSLVEAMCAGLPIAAFDVSYNRATTEDKALYFDNVESLKALIREIEMINLEEKGLEMKEIADRRYTWKIICQKYENLYLC